MADRMTSPDDTPTDPAPPPVALPADASLPHLRLDRTSLRLDAVPEQERRATIAAIAAPLAGLGAAETWPGRRDAYARAIGCDDEPPWFRSSYVPTATAASWNASSCGLTCRAILHLAGIIDPALAVPYQAGAFGGVMGQLLTLAIRHGARRTWRAGGSMPTLGDMVFLGAEQHIYTVATAPDDEGAHGSVEGGQIGGLGGGTEIAARSRWLHARGASLVSVDQGGHARPVEWWIDVAALRCSAAVTMPTRHA